MTPEVLESSMETCDLSATERLSVRSGYHKLVALDWPTGRFTLGMCEYADKEQLARWEGYMTLLDYQMQRAREKLRNLKPRR